jgi:hypothetical protein
MSNFIEQIKPKALQLCKQYGILPSLMIAQACHESGFGRHAPGNNLFGYKWYEGCGRDWQLLWTWECIDGQYVKVQAKFRKYNSLDESLEDYAKLIGTSKRYAPVRSCKDYKCAAYQIKACGYATGHQYDKSIINVIEQYQLYELDGGDMTAEDLEHDLILHADFPLTDNFTYKEFWSNNFGKPKVQPPDKYFHSILHVAEQLQIVRDKLNTHKGRWTPEIKILITSGYRTPQWNASKGVEGASNSKHLYGMAADSRAIGVPLMKYYSYILRYTDLNHLGYYRDLNFVHAGIDDDLTIFKY